MGREILKWIKFVNFDKVKTLLQQVLSNDSRKLVYHLSDGNNTTNIIASKTPVSNFTVSTWWRSWAKLGIVDLIPVQGGDSRGKKIFELEDFDISIPKLPETKTEEKPET